MATKVKIITLLIVITAAIAIVAGLVNKPKNQPGPAQIDLSPAARPSSIAKPSLTPTPSTGQTQPAAATGNIDDAVNALFSDSSDETLQTAKAMDDDAALLGLDSQAIGDFGQSYNETDF